MSDMPHENSDQGSLTPDQIRALNELHSDARAALGKSRLSAHESPLSDQEISFPELLKTDLVEAIRSNQTYHLVLSREELVRQYPDGAEILSALEEKKSHYEMPSFNFEAQERALQGEAVGFPESEAAEIKRKPKFSVVSGEAPEATQSEQPREEVPEARKVRSRLDELLEDDPLEKLGQKVQENLGKTAERTGRFLGNADHKEWAESFREENPSALSREEAKKLYGARSWQQIPNYVTESMMEASKLGADALREQYPEGGKLTNKQIDALAKEIVKNDPAFKSLQKKAMPNPEDVKSAEWWDGVAGLLTKTALGGAGGLAAGVVVAAVATVPFVASTFFGADQAAAFTNPLNIITTLTVGGGALLAGGDIFGKVKGVATQKDEVSKTHAKVREALVAGMEREAEKMRLENSGPAQAAPEQERGQQRQQEANRGNQPNPEAETQRAPSNATRSATALAERPEPETKAASESSMSERAAAEKSIESAFLEIERDKTIQRNAEVQAKIARLTAENEEITQKIANKVFEDLNTALNQMPSFEIRGGQQFSTVDFEAVNRNILAKTQQAEQAKNSASPGIG